MTKSRGNPWAVLVVVSLGFFMTLLDLSIVNIAIPDMIAGLPASLDDVLWVLNAYTLVLAAVLITAGRLGDLIGQRVMFIVGVTLFTVASAACGLAPGPGWLIAFRAAQGLGAAALIPQTLAILTMVFPPERRGAALGVWSAVPAPPTRAWWARGRAPASTRSTASPRHWPGIWRGSIRCRSPTATWTPCARRSCCRSRCLPWRH